MPLTRELGNGKLRWTDSLCKATSSRLSNPLISGPLFSAIDYTQVKRKYIGFWIVTGWWSPNESEILSAKMRTQLQIHSHMNVFVAALKRCSKTPPACANAGGRLATPFMVANQVQLHDY
jgi:hypothetical protein